MAFIPSLLKKKSSFEFLFISSQINIGESLLPVILTCRGSEGLWVLWQGWVRRVILGRVVGDFSTTFTCSIHHGVRSYRERSELFKDKKSVEEWAVREGENCYLSESSHWLWLPPLLYFFPNRLYEQHIRNITFQEYWREKTLRFFF